MERCSALGEEGSRFHPRGGCCAEEHGELLIMYLFVEMLQNFGPCGHKLLDIPISTGFLFLLVSLCVLSLCSIKSILLFLLLLRLMLNLCIQQIALPGHKGVSFNALPGHKGVSFKQIYLIVRQLCGHP